VWVDLEQPTIEEIEETAAEFAIGDRLKRELIAPTPQPLVTGDDEMALLVLHFPTRGSSDGETRSQEIDFVIGKSFIVTVRYELIAPLHHLKKLLETQTLVGEKSKVTTEMLLEVLFAHLYTAMHDHTNQIAESLSRVEADMFDGHERTTIRAIANVNREYLHMEAALANQEESLHHFLDALTDFGFFSDHFGERVGRIMSERAHVARIVRTHRGMATELRETNLALIESRQNEIMKTLTVITFIFLPLELITFVFAMHAPGTPFETDPNGFWIITGAMLVVGALLTLFLARKRWLF